MIMSFQNYLFLLLNILVRLIKLIIWRSFLIWNICILIVYRRLIFVLISPCIRLLSICICILLIYILIFPWIWLLTSSYLLTLAWPLIIILLLRSICCLPFLPFVSIVSILLFTKLFQLLLLKSSRSTGFSSFY